MPYVGNYKRLEHFCFHYKKGGHAHLYYRKKKFFRPFTSKKQVYIYDEV
jgi:hypothetical protein